MKQLIVVVIMLCLFYHVDAQQSASIKGSLQDTVSLKSVAYTSVLVINPTDSVILGFTHSTERGAFTINNLPAKKVRLLITRPGFADYEDFLTLSEGQITDVGTVNMISKTTLLQEVIIRDRIDAIRIKGDTTEFLVDSFLTNKHASVEELMKKLPGIQVDKDGKITAQGKEVKKVLVDGEEFFGDDPTIATKNIKATQVESIQVFDKKSEQATISGIDDGVSDKTINLKLKEDAKKGYFGKVSAGVATDSRYEHDAMFNRFNKKQKISFYGAASNTNKTGLSWDDQNKYGGSGMTEYESEDGNTYMYYSGDNMGFYGGGIPQTWYVGAHYSDKLKNDKHAFSFNGSHKEMTVRGFDANYSQYILPDTFYFNNQENRFNNFKKGDNFSGNYTLALDSFTTLKFKLSGSQTSFINNSTFETTNRNQLNALVNANKQTKTNTGKNEKIESSINLIRKFRLKGRSLSLGFTQSYNQGNDDGYLNSDVKIYTNDTTFTSTNFDQKKVNNSYSERYSGSITYTEPFGKKFFVISDYGINVNQDKSALLTLVKQGGSDYTQQLDSLSNDFRYDVLINKGGLSLKYQFKKITTSLGGRISYTDMHQNNLVNDSVRDQRFVNYFPAARFNYKLGTNTSFTINYNGRTRQPSVQQIQPLIDNSNPLVIYKGNTNLVQSFTNSFGMSYNSYKPLKGSGMWSSLSYTETYNDFAQRNDVTPDGRRTYQTVNIDGNYSVSGYLYQYLTIKKLKVSVSNNISLGQSKNVSFVNGIINANTNRTFSFGTNLGKEKENKYEIRVEADWDYTNSISSIRPDFVTSYWISSYKCYLDIYLPKKFKFETNVNYSVRQKTSEFDRNLNTVIIGMEINRKFTKKENWEVGFAVKDLLNQNIGFSRTATSNFINENVQTVLRRYFMLTVTYNFTSANKNETTNE